MFAGSLKFDTKLDADGFQKGINKMTGSAKSGGSTIKNIVVGLGITKLVEKGISMITDSIDGAVSRIDTLNNFPKVMSNLGISAKDSAKVINELSDELTGLPTSLDEAALSVQRLTSKNGDVKKSKELFLALNNAILAGGASTEIQATAMEQISQAYAKGKPDMMEWRALQTAMPAQLKQVSTAMLSNKEALNKYIKAAQEYSKANPMSSIADELLEQLMAVKKGTGDMTTAVGTGLRAGVISMDDFMNQIVTMNKKGVKGFKSLEEQARNSTGGIKTNITNMKTAITRGTASMMTSLDKGLKKANLGGIAEQINSFGKNFEKVLKRIGKELEKINWNKLISSLKIIAPLVGTLLSSLLAYKTVVAPIQAVNVAMKLLNTTMKANPAGLIVAGIAALVGITYSLGKAFHETNSATLQTNKTLKDYKQSMDAAKKAKNEYLQEQGGELSYYQSLYTELQGLVAANGRVQSGYENRAKFIVSTLNEALGTEITMTGNLIKNYDGVKKKIDDVINAKRAQVLLEAHEKEYNEAKNQKVELERQYANQLRETTNAEKQYEKTLKELSVSTGLSTEEIEKYKNEIGGLRVNDIPGLNNEQIQLANSLDDASRAFFTTNKSLSEIGSQYSNNQLIIGNYETALTNLKNKNYEAVLGMYEDTIEYKGKTDQETYNNYQNQIEMQRNYLQSLKDDKDKYDEDYYLSELKKTENTIANLTKEQAKYKQQTTISQKQIKGIWNQGMTDLMQDLTGKKVQFEKTGDGHVQMYINGVKQGKPMTQQAAKDLAQGLIGELKRKQKDGKIAGENIVNGVDEGIKYKKGSVYATVRNFGNTILRKLKSSLQEHSPSKATKQMGVYLLDGLSLGISKKQKALYNQIDKLGKTTLKRLYKSLNKKSSLNDVQKVSFWSTIVSHTKKGTTAYTQALTKLNTTKKKLRTDAASATKTFATELKKIDDEINQRKTSIMNSMNLFDRFKATKSKSKETLKENLVSQVEALKEWDQTLIRLKKKMKNKSLYNFLEDQGVSSLKTLQEIDSMSIKELRSYESLYAQKEKIASNRAKSEYAAQIKSAKQTYINNLKKLGIDGSKASRNVGKQIAAGINSGFISGMKGTTASLKKQLRKMLKSVKKELKIHSPSRVYRDDVGKQIAAGIGVGIELNTSSALKAIRSMNDEMYREMKKSIVASTNSVKADAFINSNYGINNTININNKFEGNVDLDGKKVGRVITPHITKTLKVGGAT